MTSTAFDINALKEDYSAMDESELLAIVSVDSNQYEDGAIDAARGELRRRGFDEAQLAERALALKASRYDELTNSTSEAAVSKLPRWMFWVCLIESGSIGISIWIVTYLLWKGRKSAAEGALIAILIGWVIKALLLFVVPNAWATNS